MRARGETFYLVGTTAVSDTWATGPEDGEVVNGCHLFEEIQTTVTRHTYRSPRGWTASVDVTKVVDSLSGAPVSALICASTETSTMDPSNFVVVSGSGTR